MILMRFPKKRGVKFYKFHSSFKSMTYFKPTSVNSNMNFGQIRKY